MELKNDIMEIMCNDAVFDGVNYKSNAGAREVYTNRCFNT